MYTFGPLIAKNSRNGRLLGGAPVTVTTLDGATLSTVPAPLVTNHEGYLPAFTADTDQRVILARPRGGDPLPLYAHEAIGDAAEAADTINTGRLSEDALKSTIDTRVDDVAGPIVADRLASDETIRQAGVVAAQQAIADEGGISDPTIATALATPESQSSQAVYDLADSRYVRGHLTDHDSAVITRNVIFDSADEATNSIIFTLATPTSPSTVRGNAQLRLMLGGYDSILGDALASTIIQGMHAEVNDTSSHALVIGGSYQRILDSHYSVALAGTDNRIGSEGQAANYSAALAGHNNTIEAYHSATLAGWGNLLAGAESAILAGRDSTTHGRWTVLSGHTNIMGTPAAPTRADYATLLAGASNQLGQTASGRFSAVLGGRDHRIDVEYAGVLGGKGARPNFLGSIAQAMGYFSSPGDAQKQEAFFRGQSTDAFAKQLLVDETGVIAVPPSTTWSFDGLITGQRVDAGGDEAATFYVRGMLRRVGNASTIEVIGEPAVEALGATDGASSWQVQVLAHPSMPSLMLRGQGQAGKTINWGGSLRIVGISG